MMIECHWKENERVYKLWPSGETEEMKEKKIKELKQRDKIGQQAVQKKVYRKRMKIIKRVIGLFKITEKGLPDQIRAIRTNGDAGEQIPEEKQSTN